MRQKTLLKIVGLMRNKINSGFTILEISKKLKIGYRPAYNHISEMEKEGIIKIEKIGSAKQCKLILENPKTRHFLEYLDIIRKENLYKEYPKIKIIDNLISRLTGDFVSKVHSIVLFGSYAKKNTAKTSDIDLLFIVSNLKDKDLREAIERVC